MYLNLLFKSVKADAAVAVATTTAEGAAGSEIVAERTERGERVKALIRRFLQVLVSGGGGAPEFIAGGLYLLGEVGIVIFAFSCFQNPSLVFVASLHCFLVLAITILSSFSQPKHPWSPVYSVLQIYRMLKRFFFFFFIQLFSSVPGLRSMINDPPQPASSTQQGSSYDPRKREPQFAHASALPLWELVRTTLSYIYAAEGLFVAF